jgi:hypothetical protein
MTSAEPGIRGRSTRATVIAAFLLYALGVLVLSFFFPETPKGEVTPVANALDGGTYLVLGSIIWWQRPGQTLSRIMLAFGLIQVTGALAQIIGLHYSVQVESLDWVGVTIYIVLGMCSGLLMHLFPTGRPPSPIWRLPIWGLYLSTGALAFGQMLRMDPAGSIPITVGAWLFGIIYAVGLFSAIPSLGYRFWRSRDAERAQVKWFLFAVVIATIGWFTSSIVGGVLAAALPPLAITIALMRYHLFDIDRIISRTASYTIVTGVLLFTYAAIVTTATRLLPDLNTLAVAAATLAAAALARPLLRRVQHHVDRRFNRARYDAERTVNGFVGRLATEVSPTVVMRDLRQVVTSTLEPVRVTVWTREGP